MHSLIISPLVINFLLACNFSLFSRILSLSRSTHSFSVSCLLTHSRTSHTLFRLLALPHWFTGAELEHPLACTLVLMFIGLQECLSLSSPRYTLIVPAEPVRRPLSVSLTLSRVLSSISDPFVFQIQNTKLAILNYSIMGAILLYVIIYTIIIEKGYQDFSGLVGTVSPKVNDRRVQPLGE